MMRMDVWALLLPSWITTQGIEHGALPLARQYFPGPYEVSTF